MLVSQDLATLIAVADSGSIRSAALVLGRTQPAVTQAIQRLEESVGFLLLDRSGYRARLTERGETFVQRARATVTHARELQSFAMLLSRGVEARLRIGVHGAIAAAAWLDLVRDVAFCFPDTVLEIQLGEGDAPIRRLTSDECDLAVVLNAESNRHSLSIEHQRVGEVEFVNVVLAAHVASGDESALAALPQIIVADFDDPVTSYGVVEGHRSWRVSDHRTKAAAIAAGAGWGSVPTSMVEAELRAGTLRAVSYRGLVPRSRHPFVLCRKRGIARGPVADFIWEKSASPDDKRGQSSS